MSVARELTRILADPSRAAALTSAAWTDLLTLARAEQLLGSLAYRLQGLPLPPPVETILRDARTSAEEQRRRALWEAEMARRALAPLGLPVILLKGTAFVAAGLDAGVGRSIGDLDILVQRDRIDEAERALLGAGWSRVKEDAYDDAYYRRWMHELPPLIHHDRDRMIDVHHTILPPTARPKPDAAALIASAVTLRDGIAALAPADIIVHAAAHLFADGDLAGGLRNLWDIDRLVREYEGPVELAEHARRHDLTEAVRRALRLSARLYGTPIDRAFTGQDTASDRLFERALLARDGWGRPTRPATRFAFYIRSHWLRMPPLMLARHLATKWVKRRSSS